VSSVITSKVFDNGMTCATEQAVVLVDSIKEAALDEFRRRGCYVLSPQEAEAVGKVLLEDDFSGVNKLVARQSVERIAELAKVQVRAILKRP
jgi:acetaldehyde dehydrogenase/alcohol dehydrogenase